MTTIEKIIHLIKTDKEIAENLFLFSEFPKDVSLWTDPPRAGMDYSNMTWLFVTDHQNLTLVGVNNLDHTVWCIDDEGDFHKDCNSLQDLPYEIIRGDCSYTDNETIDEYFQKYQGYKETLQRYEQWCKENNIELDKDNVYHDENGKLFSKFFHLEY